LVLKEPIDEEVKSSEVLVQVLHLQHPLQKGVTEVILRKYLLPRLPLVILGLLVLRCRSLERGDLVEGL
jgi:hypothetical protein